MKRINDNSWMTRMTNELRKCRTKVKAFLPARLAEYDEITCRFNADKAVATLAGRFNTGKSSLLDVAVSEPLLPTGEFTESGVSCHLRAGPQRRAFVVRDDEGSPVEIPCHALAIREAISLRGGVDRVDELSNLSRIELELPSFPGGEDAEWIDPPGLCDRTEMTERARKAFHLADVLVWVLRSDQFLGEAEVEELTEYIAVRGWASVLFVENAFLRDDVDQPWDYHLRQITPVSEAKLRHLATAMGFPPNHAPDLVVVSAVRALSGAEPCGRENFLELLSSVSDSHCMRVVAARCQWLGRVLRDAVAELEPLLDAAREANEQTVRRNEKIAKARNREAERLARATVDEVDNFITKFQGAVNSSASVVAAGISGDSFHKDDTYTTRLNTAIKADLDTHSAKLFADLDECLARSDGARLGASERDELKKILAPKTYYPVTVTHESAAMAKALGGAAGFLAGSLSGGIFSVPLALTGMKAAEKMFSPKIMASNVAKTQADVRVTASLTASTVDKKEVLAVVGKAYLSALPPAETEPVDRAVEDDLGKLLERLGNMADTCELNLRELIQDLQTARTSPAVA